MRIAVLAALVLAIAAFAWDAHAQTACPTGTVAPDAARVCWRNATAFIDGTTIPLSGPTSLSHTEVARGQCSATDPPASVDQVSRVTADVGVLLFEPMPALGWWCFRARHQTEEGTFGQWSAWARKEIKAPAPPRSRAPPLTVE